MAKDKLRTVRDYLPLFADAPLQFEPGARFSYSNAGFMVLGRIIEGVSGQDYFSYVRDHVYGTAGMKDTDAYEMDHDTPNLAIGYTHVDADPPGVLTNNLYLHVVKGGPAGGGFSTVSDLVRFARALESGALIDRARVDLITREQIKEGDARYGYGFRVSTVRGHRAFGHSGGFSGSTVTSPSSATSASSSRCSRTAIPPRRIASPRKRSTWRRRIELLRQRKTSVLASRKREILSAAFGVESGRHGDGLQHR